MLLPYQNDFQTFSDRSDADLLITRGFPRECRVFNLPDDRKRPLPGSHGHHDARPISVFVAMGRNVGIALDNQFLLVDLDRACTHAVELQNRIQAWGGTWAQKTPHGTQYLFRFDMDAGVRGQWHNAKLRSDELAEPYGDLKVRGYCVGPGSRVVCDGSRHLDASEGEGPCEETRYVVLDPQEPREAPEWLLDVFREALTVSKAFQAKEMAEGGRSGIPNGEHDDFLFALAGYLRGREGLSEAAIAAILEKGPLLALQGTNPADPYRLSDLARIARSAARYAPETGVQMDMGSTGWFGVDALPTADTARVEWLVDDFVPSRALVMLYGAGGVGKSTFAAWIAAQVTRRGKRFGFVGAGEETPMTFTGKVRASGGDAQELRFWRGPTLKLPEHVERIRTAIHDLNLSVLYFDALRAHISANGALHEADRTRTALQPLGEIARETGCTILGTTHERKDGSAILGSTEVENVSRMVLRLTASRVPGKIILAVSKSDHKKPPDSIVDLAEDTLCDMAGEQVMETLADGTQRPYAIGYVRSLDRTGALLVADVSPP